MFRTPRRSLRTESFIPSSFLGQENQTHHQMLISELKAPEMPYMLSTDSQDPKSKDKPRRKHKVPLTAAGMPSGDQQGVVGWLQVVGEESLS